MRWIDFRQLKGLRRFPVPPEVLAAGRVKLIAVIEASPMAVRPSAWFASAAWRPVMAAMIVIVVVAGGGGTVMAAHGALPGEKLYAVKLVAESIGERMTLTSERRFVVQAGHASRRLEEAERLLEIQDIDGDDRAARVRAAMDRYEGHVFAMNEIAVKMEPDPRKPEKGDRAFRAAEGMIDRHVRLIESATGVHPSVASAMIDPIEAAFSLEADVFEAIPADDGGEDDGRERRRGERETRVGDSLKRLRAVMEERRDDGHDGDDERRRD